MDERELWERLRQVDAMATRNEQAARRLRQRAVETQDPYRVDRTARPLLDRLTEAGFRPLASWMRSD